MSKLSEWALKTTDRELEDADWAIIAHALGKALRHFQAELDRCVPECAGYNAKLSKEEV